jgi:hypothetical protein
MHWNRAWGAKVRSMELKIIWRLNIFVWVFNVIFFVGQVAAGYLTKISVVLKFFRFASGSFICQPEPDLPPNPNIGEAFEEKMLETTRQ